VRPARAALRELEQRIAAVLARLPGPGELRIVCACGAGAAFGRRGELEPLVGGCICRGCGAVLQRNAAGELQFTANAKA
jgi:hypothetical protein